MKIAVLPGDGIGPEITAQAVRVIEALGHEPVPFTDYALPLLRFATEGKFTYPYKPWPEDAGPRLAKAV